MMTIHMEYMIGRCLDHLLAVGQHDRLEYIDELCDACHLHTVGMFVEDVECHTCHKCITHGVLLIQKSRVGSRLYVRPDSPLVNDQTDLFVRIVLIHNRTVAVDEFVHEITSL